MASPAMEDRHIYFTEIDNIMMKDPDDFTLLMFLRGHHWSRPFYIAKERHTAMPRGGWRKLKRIARNAASNPVPAGTGGKGFLPWGYHSQMTISGGNWIGSIPRASSDGSG
jgi:hypothetical protein